jgi:predicted metal-dependent HD superfamily phosphohydrolase
VVAINFPAIQLAAWFHDVIYDPRAKDNEEKSAEYAVASLSQFEIPKTTV